MWQKSFHTSKHFCWSLTVRWKFKSIILNNLLNNFIYAAFFNLHSLKHGEQSDSDYQDPKKFGKKLRTSFIYFYKNSRKKHDIDVVWCQDLTLIPIAMAVFNWTSSPSLKEPCLLSLTKIRGTFLVEAKLSRCFVNHRGLQSEATSTACTNNIEANH